VAVTIKKTNMDAIIFESLGDLYRKQEEIVDLLNGIKDNAKQEQIYSLEDLARKLDVSRRTIATWIKNGTLPHIKIGNKIWVTEEQFQTLLEQNSKSDRNDLKL
jgi:excisionase family DNA binding protein